MTRRVPRRRLYDHEAARDAVEILVELIRFLLDPRRHTQATGSRNSARGIQRFYHDLLLAGPENRSREGRQDHVGLLKVETSAMWPKTATPRSYPT